MHPTTAPNHPKRSLLFFIAQDLDENIRLRTRDLVLRLASLRRWLNGPPRFVSTRDEPKDSARGDMPVETIGGYVELYSSLAPWVVPREIDLQQLDEVSALIDVLCNFSRDHHVSIELELDGELVGAIDDGKMDRLLAEGLLGTWRRRLSKTD